MSATWLTEAPSAGLLALHTSTGDAESWLAPAPQLVSLACLCSRAAAREARRSAEEAQGRAEQAPLPPPPPLSPLRRPPASLTAHQLNRP